jgi:hypothetical protein
VTVRIELVLEPRPELPEPALAALRETLSGKREIARAYLVRRRRTEDGEEPSLVTALSLVPVEATDEPNRDEMVGLVLEVATALGDDGMGLAIGIPARRMVPALEQYGVLVYEREPA